jgi:hypothetical protein
MSEKTLEEIINIIISKRKLKELTLVKETNGQENNRICLKHLNLFNTSSSDYKRVEKLLYNEFFKRKSKEALQHLLM